MCVCVENSSFLAVAKQVYVHMWCSVGLPQWNGVYTNCKRTWMGFTHAYNSMVLFEVTRWALMYWSKHSGTQTCCSSPVWCIIHPLQPWSSSAWNNNFPSSNPTQIESFLYVLYLYICENDMTLFMPSTYGVCVLCFFPVCLAATVAMKAKPAAYVSLRISDCWFICITCSECVDWFMSSLSALFATHY